MDFTTGVGVSALVSFSIFLFSFGDYTEQLGVHHPRQKEQTHTNTGRKTRWVRKRTVPAGRM